MELRSGKHQCYVQLYLFEYSHLGKDVSSPMCLLMQVRSHIGICPDLKTSVLVQLAVEFTFSIWLVTFRYKSITELQRYKQKPG